MLALLLAVSLNTWKSVGPPGASVNTIAADPRDARVVYAGTSTGVFKSDDAGSSWRLVGSRSNCSNVVTVAIDQTDPDIVYVGTETHECIADRGDGLFRSPDSGDSWTSLEIGDPIADLKTPPGIAGEVYFSYLNCGLRNNLFLDCSSQLMRSNDFAQTFTPVFPFLSPDFLEVVSFDIDRTDPLQLWTTAAGVDRTGLFRSDDGGNSWNQVTDMSGVLGDDYAGAVAPDPRNGEVLLLSTSKGTFRSTDAGSHWTESASPELPITRFLFDPDRRGVVYGVVSSDDVFRSLDDGVSWTGFDVGINGTGGIFMLAESSDGQILYAATNHGVYVLNLGVPPSRFVVPTMPPSPVVVHVPK